MTDYPDKTCDYCLKVGMAYTFQNGETICPACLASVPSNSVELRKLVFTLRADLTKTQERVKELEEQLASADLGWIGWQEKHGEELEKSQALEAERDELKADAVRFKMHLEQKDRALAANAEEYKKLQAEFFDYTHETSKLRDQLNEAQSDLKDALRIIYEDAKYKKGFEDCRDAVIKTTKGRISAVLAQELGALTVTERGKDEKA